MKKRYKLLIAFVIFFVIFISLFMIFTKARKSDAAKKWANGEVTGTIFYKNGEKCIAPPSFVGNDIIELAVGKKSQFLINHAKGFGFELPLGMDFDFTKSAEYITASGKNLKIVASKEYTPYTDGSYTRQYIADYVNKYLLNEKFMENNKITLHKDAIECIDGRYVQVIALSRTPAPDSDVEFNTYVYCYIYTGSTMFYRIMFKAPKFTEELMDTVYRTLYSFNDEMGVSGKMSNNTQFAPEIPKNWSKQTKEFYRELLEGEDIKWGIYQPHNVRRADLSGIKEVEEKISYNFDGVLEYLYFGEELCTDGMKVAHNEGKIIELTMQTSTVMNENLDGYNPVFDILDGVRDDEIYDLAKQIKDYSHPILFRLNNEMNSDWTSYGVASCLNDPEIYRELWIKFYEIFEEVGVDNAIWVFNPNDESFPPHAYNSTVAFYPGDKYVQVFGITGYNTGTFYAEQNEKWKTFDEIYSHINERQYPIYKNFPWIITEFASSSVGGNKAVWIEDMFSDIKKYPNIKMAFWFNSADYYQLDTGEKKVARPYWIDETEETIEAFKNGVNK